MNIPHGGEVDVVAEEALGAILSGRQVAPFSERIADFDLRKAYAVTAALRRLRVSRGERVVGRKIGFTNRTIWSEYGVFAPIWGDMYESTAREIASWPGTFPLAKFLQPRIEPEIVFKLSRAPDPGMDETALVGCIEWVGHGFEIVQSLFPGWRFTGADCVAGGGLHGALLLGRPQPVASLRASEWAERLRGFEIELFRNGERMDRGQAANVLDGPLLALRHLVGLLASDPDNPPLAAGEIITTGTVTRVFPIAPGERWTTRVEGLPLDGLDVTFG